MHKQARLDFDRWFAESKVVNDAGSPLVVYHGTSKKFDAFDVAHSGKNFAPSRSGAFYFINDKAYAAQYADVVSKYKTSGKPRVIKAYLCLCNPKEMDAGDHDPNDFIDQHSALYYSARAAGHDGIIVSSSSGLKTLVAFRSDQIKRVTKMSKLYAMGIEEVQGSIGAAATEARNFVTALSLKSVAPHA